MKILIQAWLFVRYSTASRRTGDREWEFIISRPGKSDLTGSAHLLVAKSMAHEGRILFDAVRQLRAL